MSRADTERRIVRRIIRAVRAAGDPIVSVWDGEEDTPATLERDILAAVGQLDHAHLYTQSGAWAFIVCGNGVDILTDYTMDLDAALTPVFTYIDALEED